MPGKWLIIISLALYLTGCSSSRTPPGFMGRSNCTVTPLTRSTVTGNISLQRIPAGHFLMGSLPEDPNHKMEEGPVRLVTISKGFWLGTTEVTIGQWKAVMGETLREHVVKLLNDETIYEFGDQKKKLREFMNFNRDDPDRILANENDSLPMYLVSWYDAMEFCKRLTQLEKEKGHLPRGYQFTLPTEAQWEYACRAGTTSATFAGPLIMNGRNAPVLDSIAWYSGNSGIGYTGKRLGNPGAGPRIAGEKLPNAWGLRDMPGNIWEWCRDWYGPYNEKELKDPVGPDNGTGRVNRGGSWGSGPLSERSASRASNPPVEKSAWRGFRVVLSIL